MKNLFTLHDDQLLHHLIETDSDRDTIQRLWNEFYEDENALVSNMVTWFDRRDVSIRVIETGDAIHYTETHKVKTHNDMIDEMVDTLKAKFGETVSYDVMTAVNRIASSAFKAGYKYRNSDQDLRLAAAG